MQNETMSEIHRRPDMGEHGEIDANDPERTCWNFQPEPLSVGRNARTRRCIFPSGKTGKLFGQERGNGRQPLVCKVCVRARPYSSDQGASAMQTRCPKCTTIVKANGTDWAIINGACPELSGTEWENKPEFCPTLSHVVQPEIVLPGIANRAAVQEEIERVRVVKVRPLSQVE